MISRTWLHVVLVAAFLVAVDASADPITIVQVHRPAQLIGPLVIETFEHPAFTPGVRFEASEGVSRVSAEAASSGVTPSGRFGLIPNTFPAPIDLFFSSPVSSVGMFFGNDDRCCSSGFTAFLDAFAGETLLGTVGVQANMNDFADQFIGFNSAAPVSRARIRFGANDVGLFTFIDDVHFNRNAGAVPEPGTLILLASGTGLAAYRRWRVRIGVRRLRLRGADA
jgi:PEP-CTERM motif-containing protein